MWYKFKIKKNTSFFLDGCKMSTCLSTYRDNSNAQETTGHLELLLRQFPELSLGFLPAL